MSSRKFPCNRCIHHAIPFSKEPCASCSKTDTFISFLEIPDEQPQREEHYDEHYVSSHQPIETMQANMTHDEFIGFLKGNIIKYVCRLGKKDDIEKETAKIKRYAEWLEQAVKGQTIDPRK